MTHDPFDTSGIRGRVLAAWVATPARFREDANAEEDYALGGYRDRVVVELAQNAADAAQEGGGRLRLTLRDGVLLAANTGAPLDAAGVEGLSTLRASAKRGDDTAGRFGVGFASVVAVTDEPAIASRGIGGVRWSAGLARALAAEISSLADELERRDGQVPLLRLPFPLDGLDGLDGLGGPEGLDGLDGLEIPEGFDTAVRLPLRDKDAEALVSRQLEEVGPALMLALPALRSVEIDIDGDLRTLTADHGDDATATINGVDWHTVEAHGTIPPDLLADRPTEERARPTWQVRWAVPGNGRTEAPRVLHAPTPSDERIDLPALLIASFPLAPDRRHVAPGPLTGFLVERAAEAYARLLTGLPTEPALLDMVPGPVAAGELDAELRRAVLARLPETPLLPTAATRSRPAGEAGEAEEKEQVRGRDAAAVDGPAPFIELLADLMPGLLPAGWPVRHPALAALGVRRVELADVIDELSGLEREPGWWRSLYESLSGAPADSLGALPVPLADDRVVRGPRGLLIASDGVDPAALDALGLRFVHPDAVHPLLPRLSAVEAGPRAVLADPAVRAAVEGSYDADDPDRVAEAVLSLAADVDPGTEPWLAELALPGENGELYPAGELLLPASPLREVMADDAPFGVVAAELVERWGAGPLEAAGVLNGFAIARAEDANLVALADGAESYDLDDEDQWAEEILDRLGMQDLPPQIPEFQAVRDLELIAGWPAALALLAEPPWRAAVTEPAHVTLHTGGRAAVPSYTAWWLGRRPILDGRRPGEFRFAGDELLAGLYDLAPDGLDHELLLALGVRTSLVELLDEPSGAQELLDRLGDPDRRVGRAQLGALWTALADASASMLHPPELVRAVVDGAVEVADAADALVLDRPDLLPLLTGQPLIIPASGRADALAELLDLPLASEEIPGAVESAGEERPVPAAALDVLPTAPQTYRAHERLMVDGQPVPWWYADGEIHATGPGGLARGLAWAAERWEDRLTVEAILRDPDELATLQAENDLNP